MIPVSLPAPTRTEPRHFTWLALAICALSSAFFAERAVYWSRYLQNDLLGQEASGPVSLSVGKTGFRVPLAAIATLGQRRKAIGADNGFDVLRLAMTWDGTGSLETGSLQASGNRILIELESNPGRESLRARLDPFYRRLARGGELSGPKGLKVLTLSARKASHRDVIVYDPMVQNGFIARCLMSSASEGTTCHRAVLLSSGLEVRYRFDSSLLPDWRELDEAVVRKVDGYRLG